MTSKPQDNDNSSSSQFPNHRFQAPPLTNSGNVTVNDLDLFLTKCGFSQDEADQIWMGQDRNCGNRANAEFWAVVEILTL